MAKMFAQSAEKQLKWLYGLQSSGVKLGLDNIRHLLRRMGDPQKNFRTIHVAGSDGKGSTCAILASVLRASGYRVGLYTSPHIIRFNERIQIDGVPISDEDMAFFASRVRHFADDMRESDINCTFFEVTTAMAFKYFADMKVDIAVIEVGLGGRLDCTNIITPILSIITNIGLDHTQFLGSTLEEIALEKAGIIKQRIPVVVGETTPETRAVFEAIAEDAHAPLIYAEDRAEVINCQQSEQGLTYRTEHYGIVEGELGGIYQEKNTNTILCAIRQLEMLGYMHPVSCDPDSPCQNKEVREGMKMVTELT
jgi:dihydrofolate synthase/folylpolyglutamate synthase